ncbi:MAG: MCE family protein [Elusimicrobiaceae bacterium]|nr:MCE family protein [Elusimicrobiaceae bacterium]
MSTETKVGLFTFIGLVLLGLCIFALGSFSITKGYDITVHFTDVSGLPAKSNVRLNGVEVGKVKELKIEGGEILALLKINEGVIIYKNSKFAIAATSLIGTNYLQIEQGNPQSGILEPGSHVTGMSLPSITNMITDALNSIQNLTGGINDNGKFAEDLNAALENLRNLSGNLNDLIFSLRPYLTKSMQEVSELTKASNEVMQDLQTGKGLFPALVSDEKMRQDVEQTLANIKQVSDDAKQFVGQMAKFRIFWLYDAYYQPNGRLGSSDLFVKFVPGNGYTYYSAGVANLGNKDNMPKNDKDFRDFNQIDVRLGVYNQWGDLAVGMIRGSGGVRAAVKPFYKANNFIVKNFALYGEATDFGRKRVINGRMFDKPFYALGAQAWINKNVGFNVRYNDIAEASALQIGANLSFEDKELASLLGLARMAN